MKKQVIKIMLATIVILGFASNSSAAIVDINSLNVNTIGVTFSSSVSLPMSQSTTFSPPQVWTMGQYQGQIVSSSVNTGIGTVTYLVESTGLYGGAPSSGSIDTTAGTIDLILADLHMTMSGILSGSFDLWNASTSTVDTNSYNLATQEFNYVWSDTASVLYGSLLTVPVDYSISVVGTVSAVPIPPALLLFGSGIVGLLGIARRAKSKA